MNKGRPPMVLSVCLLCVALLILYVALDTSGSFRFKERPGFMHYGMLAEAFVSGQLHLKQKVDPERLSSRDPLDPSTPYPFMFDAIIWNGKYYFHHEPLPGFHSRHSSLRYGICSLHRRHRGHVCFGGIYSSGYTALPHAPALFSRNLPHGCYGISGCRSPFPGYNCTL